MESVPDDETLSELDFTNKWVEPVLLYTTSLLINKWPELQQHDTLT